MPLSYPTFFASGCRQDEREIFALSQRITKFACPNSRLPDNLYQINLSCLKL